MDAVWLDRREGISITPDGEPRPDDVRRITSLEEVPSLVREGGPLPRAADVAAAPSA